MEHSEYGTAVRHRQVFRDEVRDAIRDAIFTLKLKPGDRVIETFWAKEMGTSQGPVREAIRDLEAMGLVETVPFKGSRVRAMTEKDIQDNYSVRICLESKSIRDAINQLDDEGLEALAAQLEEIVEQMDACAEQSDLMNFTDRDAAFHRAIIDATGNTVLLRLWEQCNMRNWFMFSSLTDRSSLKQLQAGHQRLLTEIRNRELEKATVTLEEHLTNMMHGFMNG